MAPKLQTSLYTAIEPAAAAAAALADEFFLDDLG
jgi:hypothetical protein